MPSNKTITPLIGGKYYHIFNRGINRENIFFQPRNYDFFLILLEKYLNECVDVLAYCLIPNHFHLLIKVSEKIVVKPVGDDSFMTIDDEIKIGEIVSEKFRRMFISYSQAINRQENRSGSLFTRNFKRIELEDDLHLQYLFFYIHFNPEKHGLIQDFRNYRFSSYQTYNSQKQTNISRKFGLELFDGIKEFIAFHEYYHEEKENLILEQDGICPRLKVGQMLSVNN